MADLVVKPGNQPILIWPGVPLDVTFTWDVVLAAPTGTVSAVFTGGVGSAGAVTLGVGSGITLGSGTVRVQLTGDQTTALLGLGDWVLLDDGVPTVAGRWHCSRDHAAATSGTVTVATAASSVSVSGLVSASAVSDHVDDASGAHAASAISFSPTGTVAATTVQAAIAEVATDAASALSASDALAATDAELAAAVANHEADTTSVHGIADTSALYRSGGTDVAVADGGTGASSAADARTNLGAASSLSVVGAVGSRFAALTIIVYHTVPSAATFATDLDWFREWNYTTIDLDEWADFLDGVGELPDKPLLITFDDGYATVFSNAYPELLSRSMKATIYIVPQFIDGAISLSYNGYSTPMTWANAQTMFNSGLIDFQSHSYDHPDLTTITSGQVATQFTQSKAAIEANITGANVRHIAYPYGSFNTTVQSALTGAGCRTGRAVRIDPRTGGYLGANLGRQAFCTSNLDRMALPAAGSDALGVATPNYLHIVHPDEELVPNGGFESGAVGWTLGTGFARDTADKNSGAASMKCTQQSSTVSSVATRLIPVGGYQSLEGSVWIKTAGLSTGVTKVQVQKLRADNTTVINTTDAVTVTGNNGAWTKYEWSQICEENTYYIKVYLWCQGNGSPAGAAWWDDLSIRRRVMMPTHLGRMF